MSNPYEVPEVAHEEASRVDVLSDEDRAELAALREERARRQAEAEAAKAAEPDPTHYMHLADGRVLEATGQMTHYKGVQVVGMYPITKEEVTA